MQPRRHKVLPCVNHPGKEQWTMSKFYLRTMVVQILLFLESFLNVFFFDQAGVQCNLFSKGGQVSIRTGIVMSKCFSFETVVNPETLLGGGLKCYCLSYVVAQSFHPCPSQTTWILKCSDFLLEKIQLWRPLSHFISYQLI